MSSNQVSDIPLVSRESVEFFASMFKDIDDKTYALLRAATIPNDIHKDTPYEYLPESCLKNCLEVLAQHLEDDRLGWLFLRSCKESFIPRMLMTISKTTSLKDALEQFCKNITNESTATNVYLEQKGGTWWLVREKIGVEDVWFKYAEMFSVIYMAELLRSLTNNQWSPNRIGVQSPCIEDFSKLSSLDQAQFFIERPVTAVEISEVLLFAPVKIEANVKRREVVVSSKDLNALSFKEQFELAISPYLSMGKLPIKLAAEILRMNVRTLQRRLSSEGIVYKQCIEELVFEKIAYHLHSSDESITQIANRFGYSDSAHFSRSFKRIFNQSPSTYRKQSR
ncbi:AraC family transcriptional regulator [Vibrio cyclitrophicus]|nr:helix-turn-helix domain-containing protein [Vibrio cyclitrophicus]UPR53069.1 AraC family transcriptional regulator [Vibrio cyclitrophicus]